MSAAGSAMLPTTGDLIDGKYALERIIGRGGMGAVYAARHIKLGHAVAIKVMLADASNHEAAQRFINEGRAAANIQNEHVVRVSDVDEEHGYAYMVLELLEGEDLAQVLERQGRIPAPVAVGYVLQALEGVRQAHTQGIVHRDLKPSNLFLAKRQNGSVVVKVLDFGISKANASSPLGQTPGQLTSTKAMLGSPLYMSPEQLRSSKSVDARADIWAIGIILYELITGKLPFMGENLGELFAAILETDAAPLRAHVDVPAALDAIVARCLQRRPEHRFQTAAELERELAPFTNPAFMSAAHVNPMHPGTIAMGPPGHSGPMAATGPGVPGLSGAASTGPGLPPAAPVAFAMTPDRALGPHVPLVHGTVPIGATTPQPQQRSTGSAWQSSGSHTKPSNLGLYIGLGSLVLALGGAVLGGLAYRSHRTAAAAAAAASASSVSPVPSETATQDPTAATVGSAPSASSVASVASTPSSAPSASATTPSTVAVGVGGKHHPATPPKIEPPKVEPPRVEPPRVEPPKVVTQPTRPPPTAAATSTVQLSR